MHQGVEHQIWHRLLVTVAAMLIASLIAGQLWLWVFNSPLPSYLGGMVGGLAALPVWELLKRLGSAL